LRKNKGRLGGKSCIVLVTFIDSCEIIGEGWWQSARMEIIHTVMNHVPCKEIHSKVDGNFHLACEKNLRQVTCKFPCTLPCV